MTPSDEQLIRTLTMLGCPEYAARAIVPAQRDGALVIHRHLQAAVNGDERANEILAGLRTVFAFRFDLKASPASSCDFDDDAVAREREAVAERRKQEEC